MSSEHREKETAEVAWEGDSLEVIRGFPGPARQDLGAELRRLQTGDRPLNSRPMPSIGARVYELREQDERPRTPKLQTVSTGMLPTLKSAGPAAEFPSDDHDSK